MGTAEGIHSLSQWPACFFTVSQGLIFQNTEKKNSDRLIVNVGMHQGQHSI